MFSPIDPVRWRSCGHHPVRLLLEASDESLIRAGSDPGVLTRARREMTILVSADPPPAGLVADYLAQADSPPGDPALGQPASRWVAELADDLSAGGVAVMPSYPTGRHVVDICVPDGLGDIAIECGIHPAGPDEHIDRHLSLLRAGWLLLEVFPSRWSGRRGELVVELLRQVKARDRM